MNKEEILTALKSVIMQMDPDLPADAIIPAADLRNDLAFDSLDIYELLWHLDKELNLRDAWHENDFPKLENCRTVADIADLYADLSARPTAGRK